MQLKQGTHLQGGKYKIKRVLGQGGFGITYLAEQDMLDRQVAIKEFFFKEYCGRDEHTCHVTLGTETNKETVERFLQKFIKEARTISRLHHPGIIEIYDIFLENNTAYYVMEYIEGESLGDIVKSRGALPEREALRYIHETADVLSYIHHQNINHLDIKPKNLMLRSRDSKVIVIDFGVSKQYDETTKEGTTTTPVGISHGYSPAEQYKAHGVSSFSPQSDIYSLGATLYTLLTGVTPPEALDVAVKGLPAMTIYVSDPVKRAIEAAMQFRKDDRPQSIAEFLTILDTATGAMDDPGVAPSGDDDEDTRLVGEEKPGPTPEKPEEPFQPTEKSSGSSAKLLLAIVVIAAVIGLCWYATTLSNPTPTEPQPTMVFKQPMQYQDGSLAYYWTGDLVDGAPQGKGKIDYDMNDKDNRYTYEGNVEQGLRQDSLAVLTYRNGNSYRGSFENDNFKQGRLTLKNDGVYFEGSFKDNQPWNGKWKFVEDNSVYSTVTNGKEK